VCVQYSSWFNHSSFSLQLSSDIMGRVNTIVQQQTGGVSMFFNADAGDITPGTTTNHMKLHFSCLLSNRFVPHIGSGMCKNAPEFAGAITIAEAVVKTRALINTSDNVLIKAYSHVVDFGPTNLNITLKRFANCSTGGPLDICTICSILNCALDVHLSSAWIENKPRFTAIRFHIEDKSSVIVTVPGEALLELGWWIRNDTQKLGFDNTLLFGYCTLFPVVGILGT